MKNTINTIVVTTTILDTAKSKLYWASVFYAGEANRIDCWKEMQEAKEILYILETIFYCEQDLNTATKINKICKKISNASDLNKVREVALACYEEIKELKYEINKELEQVE